jgi:O-antigen ligase
VTAPPPTNPNANLLQRILDFLASPARDGSIRERVTQYGVAWDLFTSSPILGVGLGHPFPWTRLDGSSRVDFTADTPLVLPAKLGIVGVAWLAVLAVVWVMFARRLRTGIPRLVMAGWAVVILALAWTGIAVEDKGFSFALMLILALGLMDLERAPAP